jgi:hypothetical protein
MLSGGDVPLVLFYVTKMIIEDAAWGGDCIWADDRRQDAVSLRNSEQ